MHDNTLVQMSQAVSFYILGCLVVSYLSQILVNALNQSDESESSYRVGLQTGVKTERNQVHDLLLQTKLCFCLIMIDRELFHEFIDNLIRVRINTLQPQIIYYVC